LNQVISTTAAGSHFREIEIGYLEKPGYFGFFISNDDGWKSFPTGE
jgi:hypothetical protein